MTEISVVIPCLNEEKYVDGILGDLCHQARMPQEVIVVDCASADGTVAVVRSIDDKLNLMVRSSPQQSAAAARNCGAAVAASEHILFMDADVRVGPDFMSPLHETLQERPVDFVGPLSSPPEVCQWIGSYSRLFPSDLVVAHFVTQPLSRLMGKDGREQRKYGYF